MAAVIKVENLSKKFIIQHEEQEKYSTLRDEMTNKAKKLLSLPFKIGKSKKASSREEFWALRDINFEIQQGDRLGIIGRNGAGKSTLLKVLSRITEPSTGSIRIRGRVASLLEVGTGFHPELTGRENIFLNGAILGMSRVEIRKKFDEIVAFAEVEKFLDTPVKRYSSGMYVRLAFGVAAHLEPEILIVDEVLAVGDAQFQKKCLGKMEDISKNEGRTVLFVSHNMGVITQLCNKGILLNQGKIEISGPINNVLEQYISNNTNGDGFGYVAKEVPNKDRKNYFTKIWTVNGSDEVASDYSFGEKIKVKFNFTLNEKNPNILINIGFQDKIQNRIFTLLKEASAFKNIGGNQYSGSVELPASIIAPNTYSFSFQIWARDIAVYDNIENVCRVKIHDSGTEFAQYEGFDYGNIIVTPTWKYD